MRVRVLTVLLVVLGLIAYFGYHMIAGDHGLRARAPMQQQVIMLEGELSGLKAVRSRLERDVALLRSDQLDPDMLDERARAILNLAHPHDLVVLDTRAVTASPR